MALAEFDLIQRYFAIHQPVRSTTRLGIGDDCALLELPLDQQLAITADTMVEGVHFFPDVSPHALGHKLLAVNLSDLAAMGAEPVAVTLALTLPTIDHEWLSAFSTGFMELANQFQVDLIGGDTTQGPLTLTVQAMGVLPKGTALLRSGAKVGDGIFVSGPLGDGGLGLKIRQGFLIESGHAALAALERPWPQVELGLELRKIATACIDISDGLIQDLGHILNKSGVGASLFWEQIPFSKAVSDYCEQTGDWQMPLSAGDDYQLCFTVSESNRDKIPSGCVCIGQIVSLPGLSLFKEGDLVHLQAKGYEHFS
jgi:thiamine-monophosphate kinase